MLKNFFEELRGGFPAVQPGGRDSDVTLVGTDGNAVSSDLFRFRSATDSNVAVKVGGSEREPRIEIGVYYV